MIKMIAAMDERRAIWKNWKIPWHIEEDLERFRQLITGQTIIMWRWTFESLKHYYPDVHWHPLASINIILSKTLEISWVEIYKTLEEIIKKYPDIIIIWWWKTYETFLPFADELDLTKISRSYNWDSFFPKYEEIFKKDNDVKRNNIVFERWIRK